MKTISRRTFLRRFMVYCAMAFLALMRMPFSGKGARLHKKTSLVYTPKEAQFYKKLAG